MKVILTLGCHRFVLPSLAVANAIVDALKDAPQVEPGVRSGATVYLPAGEERKIGAFQAHLVNDALVHAQAKPIRPLVRAVLDQAPRAARQTRAILAEANAQRTHF